MKLKNLFVMFVIMIMLTPIIAAVDEGNEIKINNIELDKILNIGSSILALVLAILTILAFQKSKKSKLLYISAAFLLFFIKTFLIGAEIFFGEWPWVDPASSLADFGILILFFIGIMRK
ncbi:TPA: hypothetical protein HA235_04165 [Candidatus Woesearchaeota archaeon]|nr:hypothetical protein [uncultured archaeon]MBS3173031.1 hypothetical protein [Candidatus Woesearchaeota archaeon]AQS32940.1 hypothetical protein [uncultured archaeon]HIH31879.1 hypothetical protein [Candidatus Woesearchaeota archaeon]HIH54370.1 hypothetical protein [Candidatus Woesearchaeota archaeon]